MINIHLINRCKKGLKMYIITSTICNAETTRAVKQRIKNTKKTAQYLDTPLSQPFRTRLIEQTSLQQYKASHIINTHPFVFPIFTIYSDRYSVRQIFHIIHDTV